MAGAHARLRVHILGNINQTLGDHRPNRDLATPNSLMRAIKLGYILPALLQSPNGGTEKEATEVCVGRQLPHTVAFLLLWLTAYTRPVGKRQSGMPPNKLWAKRSSNVHRQRVATREGRKSQHVPLGQSRAQRALRRRRSCWLMNSRPESTPSFRGRGGCSDGERYRGRRSQFSHVAAGQGVRPPSVLVEFSCGMAAIGRC